MTNSAATRNDHRPQNQSAFYQRLGHDDADLAFWHRGEVGEQALEDILSRLALRVDADGHHGRGTFLSLRTADWRDGGFAVSVPDGWGCGNDTESTRWETVLLSQTLAVPAQTNGTGLLLEKFPNMDIVPNMLNIPEGDCTKGTGCPDSALSFLHWTESVWK